MQQPVGIVPANRSKYHNAERAAALLQKSGLDALVVNSPESVTYFSGFYNPDIRVIFERFHFVVLFPTAAPAFVVVEKRKQLLQPGECFIEDVRTYKGEGLDSMRALAEVLQERGVSRGRVGLEGRSFPAGHFWELQRRLPEVLFEDALALCEDIRAVKTQAEIDVLRRVNRLTAEAMDAAFAATRVGDTERRLATRIQCEMLERGVESIHNIVLGSGDRSGQWHTVPIDRRLEAGTVVKADIAGTIDAYLSDIARTVVAGSASQSQRDIHAKLTGIKHLIVKSIRPGMLASELAVIGRDAYGEVGLEFKWNILGHAIGLGIHEAPQVYPWEELPLLPNMAMMIEVGYTDPPRDSFAVEDLILVTESGAEYLTDAAAHERIWELG